ncbi:MAG: hypothetical protein QOE90_3490 [Thermoplasmata archaeon]|jgi:hypothetical protein|nr:hypothetical protein [Thermoplasmata archaeon]
MIRLTRAVLAAAIGLALLAPLSPSGAAMDLRIAQLHYVLHGVHTTDLDVNVAVQPDGSINSEWTFPQALTTVEAQFGADRSLSGSSAYSFLWVNPSDIAAGSATFGYDNAQLVASNAAGSVFQGERGIYTFGPQGYLVSAQSLVTGSVLSLTGATIGVGVASPFPPSSPQTVTTSNTAHDFNPGQGPLSPTDPLPFVQRVVDALELKAIPPDPSVGCASTIDDPLGGFGGIIVGNPLGGPGQCTQDFSITTTATVTRSDVVFPALATGQITASLENPAGQVYYSTTCTADLPADGLNVVGVLNLNPACGGAPSPASRAQGNHVLVVTASFDHCLNPATQFRCPFGTTYGYVDG